MSRVDFEKVVGRAVSDISFRNQLLANVDKVIGESKSKLSASEIAALKKMKAKDYEKLAAELNEHLHVNSTASYSGRCAKATGF